eukprot:CAMPEP_0197415136 /NCGR_PEP_ID=MMETSP1170-20131217/1729_1 /TAXON_ID=54406 /ORGANISM="Sarcinochrysis sp, Strain CCMP770" /LENGTH=133 /DNA_ID=CAMNT_0042941903 /DNA_START=73 /DNA_END=472 /DNA_ORIENTATION=+
MSISRSRPSSLTMMGSPWGEAEGVEKVLASELEEVVTAIVGRPAEGLMLELPPNSARVELRNPQIHPFAPQAKAVSLQHKHKTSPREVVVVVQFFDHNPQQRPFKGGQSWAISARHRQRKARPSPPSRSSSPL